jgi:hypothetical protein
VSPVDSALLVGVGSDEPRASRSNDTADDHGSDFGDTLQKVATAPDDANPGRARQSDHPPTAKDRSSSPPPSAAPASSSTPPTPVPAGVPGSVPASVGGPTPDQKAGSADGGSTTADPSDLTAVQGAASDSSSSVAGQTLGTQTAPGQIIAS